MGTSRLKVLVAGGDSFVYGTELSDQKTGIPSKSTFPALLARDANMHYQCVAKPGASNSEISRHVINYCETHKDLDLNVFVSWTFPNRYEFFLPDIGWQSVNVWNIQTASEIKKQLRNYSKDAIDDQLATNSSLKKYNGLIKEYFAHLGSNKLWEQYTSLKEIASLQNYLKANNIPYMFTYADDSVIGYVADVSIESLYTQIDFNKVFSFAGSKGFYQWSLDNKYKVGATHPLEEAHVNAAKLMRDKFHEIFESPI